MIPTRDLPPPPATPPSAIAAMLKQVDPRLGGISMEFTTLNFISRFSMTALEGHQRLNEMAADGLLAHVPNQPVETWQLTRDGAYVLSPERKRVTKKFIAALTDCLKAIGPELMRQGAVELSVGGRPMAGKPNGQVLVGLRLKNAPFANPADDGMLQQLCAALDAAVGSGGYAPMLFSERVPLRLQERTIIAANEAALGALQAGGEQIDEDESEQAAWCTKLRTKHQILDGYAPFHFDSGLPMGLLNALEDVRIAAGLPLLGSRSASEPDDNAILSLCAAHSASYDKDCIKWRGEASWVCAELECCTSANELDKYLQNVRRQPLGIFDRHPLRDLALRDSELERAAAHALHFYREHLATSRAATVARGKPKADVHYLTFFDTLNFGAPRVVGFVRQPAGHNAHVDALVDRWNTALRGLDGGPSEWLSKAGYKAGGLSLDVRDATPEEVAAFQSVCKREGATFRYFLFLPRNRMMCLPMGRLNYRHVELDIPDVFRAATLGRPVHPRLIAPQRYFEQLSLKEVVREAEPLARAALEQNIVFIDEVLMSDFARHATFRPCINPTVLSSKVLDAWTFSASQGGDWRARATGKGWSVELTAEGCNLDLTLTYQTRTEKHRLAPYAETFGWGQPYDNTLNALLGLLSTVRNIYESGELPLWTSSSKRIDELTEAQIFSSFAYELYQSLHRGCNYVWPDFTASAREAALAEASDA